MTDWSKPNDSFTIPTFNYVVLKYAKIQNLSKCCKFNPTPNHILFPSLDHKATPPNRSWFKVAIPGLADRDSRIIKPTYQEANPLESDVLIYTNANDISMTDKSCWMSLFWLQCRWASHILTTDKRTPWGFNRYKVLLLNSDKAPSSIQTGSDVKPLFRPAFFNMLMFFLLKKEKVLYTRGLWKGPVLGDVTVNILHIHTDESHLFYRNFPIAEKRCETVLKIPASMCLLSKQFI